MMRRAPVLCMVKAKGEVLYRLDKTHPDVRGKEALEKYREQYDAAKVAEPKSKKEALQHCLQRPNHEYVSDFQRAAHDMMAIQSEPMKYANDMSYHYHRIWKANNASKTWTTDGNDSADMVRVRPPG